MNIINTKFNNLKLKTSKQSESDHSIICGKLGVFLLCLGSILLVSGCASLRPSTVTSGADPNIEGQRKFMKVDLIAQLDPMQYGRRAVNAEGAIPDPNDPEAEKTNRGADIYENALLGFRIGDYDESRMLRRNGIQDRLISASVISCTDYKKDVLRFKGDLDFFSKSISLGLDAAGALTTGGASQILSGVSAAVLGVGTTADAAYMNSLTLSVIFKSIDDIRNQILIKIRREQLKPHNQYSVEAAIADALEYHQSCSIIAGIQKADETASVSKSNSNSELEEVLDDTNEKLEEIKKRKEREKIKDETKNNSTENSPISAED